MKAIIKFFVYLIVLALILCAIAGAIGVYEFVQLGQNKDDLVKIQSLTMALCKTEDPTCLKKVAEKYGPCVVPSLTAAERSECLDRAYAEALSEFYPDLATATMSSSQIENWAKRAAEDALTFDATNVSDRLSLAQNYFTLDGWVSFTKALTESGTIQGVQAKKLSISLTVDGSATSIKGGLIHGIYTWDVDLPVTLAYLAPDAAAAPNPIKATLFLKITRSPFTQNPNGVGIKQWVIRVEP